LQASAEFAHPVGAVPTHESLFTQTRRRFFRHRLAVIGMVVLVVIAVAAIVGPLFLQDPNFTDLRAVQKPPSAAHPLGTDQSGRDVLARLISGARTSLIVGFGAVAVYVTIGTIVGLSAGYFGGATDQILMRATDTVLSIPTLLMTIVFVSVVGPSLISVIAVIGLLGWPQVARIVRSQILALRESEFVTAARVVGVGNRQILWRHLLPNTAGALIVVATFGVATAILLEAGLSFLGLGVQPPDSSLGIMVNEARSPAVLNLVPWLWIPAGLLIALIVLSANFIGDGLRDALDPRSDRTR
jgi:peptide/nickel transport system permease protein